MEFVFIVNPTSGNGKALVASKVIEQYLIDLGVNFKIFYTKGKSDASTIASTFKDKPNTVLYSVGGDGTLNEVVNGIATSNTKLGIIPAGTGNDFYKSISSVHIPKIDLGKVNDKYFINIASLGLDAEVAREVNELKKKNIPNSMVYYVGLLKSFITYKNIDICINKLNYTTTIVTICNGKYYGGGFKIAPKAILNDGMFDIIYSKDLNKLRILSLISKILSEKHLLSPDVIYYKKEKLQINSSIPLTCNIDGEIITDNSFKFSLIKEGISLYKDNNLKINNMLKEKKLIN